MRFSDVGDLGDSIHLWTIPLDGPAARQVQDARLLSADEAARAARFRFARDRRRFIAGRGALRRILAHYLAAAPEALCFAYGAAGKPALARPQAGRPIQFNLSHCEHLGLFALAHDRPARLLATRWRPAEAGRWSLADIALDPDFRAAIAIKGPLGEVRSWHLSEKPEEGSARITPLSATHSVPFRGWC